jgi:hypothetical protein
VGGQALVGSHVTPLPSAGGQVTLPKALEEDQHDAFVIARRYLTDTSMAQLHASRQTDPVQLVELTPGA